MLGLAVREVNQLHTYFENDEIHYNFLQNIDF